MPLLFFSLQTFFTDEGNTESANLIRGKMKNDETIKKFADTRKKFADLEI